MSSERLVHALPPGFQLEEYRIERQLSKGGFSIVYLARDAAGKAVAIKEYLPARLAQRAADSPLPVIDAEHRAAFNRGLKCFFEEGRLLTQINHPNVVRVLNFFRANDTAYLVMRYERGCSLDEHIRKEAAGGAAVGEDFLREVFVRLLSGLREVHIQKLLHLDIKPANIYLRQDYQPVLLDFGATRQGLAEGSSALMAVHTRGFAAPEQQGSGEALGPWTDIYSVGATLYACLAGGGTPQSADQRMVKDELPPAQQRWARRYSLQLLELIDWCMKLHIGERPQSVFALQKVLNGDLLDLVDPAWFETPPRSS